MPSQRFQPKIFTPMSSVQNGTQKIKQAGKHRSTYSLQASSAAVSPRIHQNAIPLPNVNKSVNLSYREYIDPKSYETQSNASVKSLTYSRSNYGKPKRQLLSQRSRKSSARQENMSNTIRSANLKQKLMSSQAGLEQALFEYER